MTAVEFYRNCLYVLNKKGNITVEEEEELFEQAKEMEIKQAQKYAEFAIRCDREFMKVLNFDGYNTLNSKQ